MKKNGVSISRLFSIKVFRFLPTSLGTATLCLLIYAQSDTLATVTAETPTPTPTQNADTLIAQSGWSNTLSRLGSHVVANRAYFNSYALNAANTIADGERVNWSRASMNINNSNGYIVLSLMGQTVVTGFASLFVTPPAIELHILFRPDECFQYSYADYQLGVDSSFAGMVNSEVNTLLVQNRADIENSLNNEVYYTLSSIQALEGLGCY